MDHQVRYTLLAQQDVSNAFAWYRTKAGDDVAERFMVELARCEGHLRSNPFLYRRMAAEVRQLVLRRFPYVLVYAIDRDCVVVLGCFHSSRNPLALNEWLARGKNAGVVDDGLH